MDNNPLYPGYAPDDKTPPEQIPGYVPTQKDIGQQVPGYYPGKPFVRSIRDGGVLEPITFSMGVTTDYLDALSNGFAEAPYLPFRRLMDDLKGAGKAQVFGSAAVPVEQIDEYDLTGLRGSSGLAVSLNPDDLSDPEKWMNNTLKAAWKTVANMDEFTNRTNTLIWEAITRGETEIKSASAIGTFGALFAGAGAISSAKDRATRFGDPKTNSFKLYGVGITKTYQENVFNLVSGTSEKMDKTVDVFEDFAKAVVEFQKDKDNAFFRDTKYDEVLKKAMTATSTELEQKVKAGFFKSTEELERVNLFLAQSKVISDIGEYGGTFKGMTDNLTQMVQSSDAVLGPQLLETLNKANSKADSVKKSIASLRSLKITSLEGKAEVSRMLKELEGVEAHITGMENLIGTGVKSRSKTVNDLLLIANKPGSFVQRGARASNLYTQLGNMSGKIKGDGSYERRFLKSVVDQGFFGLGNNSYSLNAVFRGQTNKLESFRLLNYLDRMHEERIAFATDEKVKDFSKGINHLIEKRFWSEHIVPAIEGYTPKYYAQMILKRIHYFGLVIDEERLMKQMRGPGFMGKIKGALGLDPNAPGMVFGNYFRLDFKHNGTRYLPRIYGGSHFTLVDTLAKAVKDKKIDISTLGLLLANVSDPTSKAARDLLARNGITLANLGLADDKELRAQWAALQGWVHRNKKRFGNANLNDAGFWTEFMRALMAEHFNENTLKITRKFAGLLEKAWSTLNKIQTKFLNRFGKFIAPITYISNFVADRVADLIPKLLAVVFGGATGGIAGGVILAVSRLMRPIVRAVTKATMDFAQNFVLGALRGDLLKAFNELQKLVVNLVKTITVIVGVPVLALAAVSTIFMGASLTTMSPIDAAKNNSGAGGGFQLLPPGEGLTVTVRKDVVVTYYAGSFTNPKEPIPNEALTMGGIDVAYIATITPKVTISDQSVSYTDKAKIKMMDGVNEELFPTQSGILDPFVNGTPIIIDLPETHLDSLTYADSIVSNELTANMPAVIGMTESPQAVSFTRSFRIGNFVAECPLYDYVVMTNAYSTADAPTGHGRNDYWVGICEDFLPDQSKYEGCLCNFPIPWAAGQNGCPGVNCAPLDSASVCYDKWTSGSSRSATYGAALDVRPPQQVQGSAVEVWMPALGNPNREWSTDRLLPNNKGGWGYGLIATSFDAAGDYVMYITHMAQEDLKINSTLRAGDQLGWVFTNWLGSDGAPYPANIHIHIEISENGVWKKPREDSVVCYQ